MKKIVNLTCMKGIHYVYRISSISVDKISMEKHAVDLGNRKLDDVPDVTFEISDDTKVGSVTQKLKDNLIAKVTKMVDVIILDFNIEDKRGISSLLIEGGTLII